MNNLLHTKITRLTRKIFTLFQSNHTFLISQTRKRPRNKRRKIKNVPSLRLKRRKKLILLIRKKMHLKLI
jgi:hypothetical protein